MPDARAGCRTFSACSGVVQYAGLAKANESSGLQLCYTVGQVIDAWSQPLLALAVRKISAEFGPLTDEVVASSFHKADAKLAIDVVHYAVSRADIWFQNSDTFAG